MNQKKYVQHISGHGEKWELSEGRSSNDTKWVVKDKNGIGLYYLPMSEYTLCCPPEEWEDVTGEFTVTEDNWPSPSKSKSNAIIYANTGYVFWAPSEMHHSGDLRLEKIDGLHHGPAFIVERKKS